MRLRRRLVAVLVLAGLLAAVGDASAQSIYVREGGDGEISVSTPWGEYAIYDQGGGAYWVGTQRAFDRQRVVAIARSDGDRVSTVNDGADATFVPETTYRTQVGDVALDGIGPDVMFSIPKSPPRPVIPSGDRYVSISWLQDAPAASPMLVNPKSGQFIRPYSHGDAGNGIHFAEFAVPRATLTKKELIVFTIPNRTPGVVALRSIAWANFQIVKGNVEELEQGGSNPAAEDFAQLRKLRLLDPSLR